MATILRTDGKREPIAGPLSLAKMQEIVGGYIEVVYLGGVKQRRDVLVVNENGRNDGLPINHAATFLYRGNPPRHSDFIVGDAIVALVLNAGEDNEQWI